MRVSCSDQSPGELNNERRVFFLHVPKTGGISLGTYLQSIFAPESICPQPFGGGHWRSRGDDVKHYSLFWGHFDIDFIERVDPHGFKLTILRDPVARIISMYDFWRSIDPEWSDQHLSEALVDAPRFARGHTFGAFLRTDHHEVQQAIENSTTRQLLGHRYAELAADPAEAARVACERLQTFDWYTTTDHLSAALPELAARLRKPAPNDPHLNRTYAPAPHDPRTLVFQTEPLEADLRYCKLMNQIDLTLYRLASEARRSPVRWPMPAIQTSNFGAHVMRRISR